VSTAEEEVHGTVPDLSTLLSSVDSRSSHSGVALFFLLSGEEKEGGAIAAPPRIALLFGSDYAACVRRAFRRRSQAPRPSIGMPLRTRTMPAGAGTFAAVIESLLSELRELVPLKPEK
jgi:hypothetical protein